MWHSGASETFFNHHKNKFYDEKQQKLPQKYMKLCS